MLVRILMAVLGTHYEPADNDDLFLSDDGSDDGLLQLSTVRER